MITIGHHLVPLTPLIIVLVAFAGILAINFLSNPLRNRIKDLGGQMNFKGEGIFAVDGKEIKTRYIQGGRNRMPEFRISMPGNFGANLVIRTETRLDRFFKNIGLNKEVQVPDQELDDKFYFECDVPEFVNQLFMNADAKSLVMDILNEFTSIEITPKACTLRLLLNYKKNIEVNKEMVAQGKGKWMGLVGNSFGYMSQEKITSAARKLLNLIPCIPQAVGASHPELATFEMWKGILLVLGQIVGFGGIVFLIWGQAAYRVVDAGRFWYFSSMVSLSVFLVVAVIAYVNVKGFSTSSRVFIPFLFSSIFGFLLLARYGGAVYNGKCDQSAVKIFEQRVIDKYTSNSKSSTYYHLTVAPWRAGMKNWSFTVSQNRYDQAQIGFTRYQISTKSGRLGFEWVVAEKLIVSDRDLIYTPHQQISSDYQKIIQTSAEDDNAQGIKDFKQGHSLQALDEFSQAIKLAPNGVKIYDNRGAVYVQQGQLTQAMADYNKAIELNSKDGEGYYGRAIVYYYLKQYDKAFVELHQAQALGTPINPNLLNALVKASK